MTTYLIVYIAIAIWMFLDARKRHYNGIPWAALTALFGPLVVPFYFAKRPLRAGEVREGGFGWNVCKYFAIFWTLTMSICFFVGMFSAADHTRDLTSDAERAGAGIGMALGAGLIFVIWIFGAVGALVLGLLLKKSTIVERGASA